MRELYVQFSHLVFIFIRISKYFRYIYITVTNPCRKNMYILKGQSGLVRNPTLEYGVGQHCVVTKNKGGD